MNQEVWGRHGSISQSNDINSFPNMRALVAAAGGSGSPVTFSFFLCLLQYIILYHIKGNMYNLRFPGSSRVEDLMQQSHGQQAHHAAAAAGGGGLTNSMEPSPLDEYGFPRVHNFSSPAAGMMMRQFDELDARVSLNTPFQQRIHSGHTVGVSETPTTHETMNWGGIGEEVNEGSRVEMRNASMLRLNDSIFEMPVVFPQQPSRPLDTYASSSAVIPPAAEGLHMGDEGDLDSEVDLREMFESTTTSPSLNVFITRASADSALAAHDPQLHPQQPNHSSSAPMLLLLVPSSISPSSSDVVTTTNNA